MSNSLGAWERAIKMQAVQISFHSRTSLSKKISGSPHTQPLCPGWTHASLPPPLFAQLMTAASPSPIQKDPCEHLPLSSGMTALFLRERIPYSRLRRVKAASKSHNLRRENKHNPG